MKIKPFNFNKYNPVFKKYFVNIKQNIKENSDKGGVKNKEKKL